MIGLDEGRWEFCYEGFDLRVDLGPVEPEQGQRAHIFVAMSPGVEKFLRPGPFEAFAEMEHIDAEHDLYPDPARKRWPSFQPMASSPRGRSTIRRRRPSDETYFDAITHLARLATHPMRVPAEITLLRQRRLTPSYGGICWYGDCPGLLIEGTYPWNIFIEAALA